jgi:hypothetical protein
MIWQTLPGQIFQLTFYGRFFPLFFGKLRVFQHNAPSFSPGASALSGINEQGRRPIAPEMRLARFPAVRYLLHFGKDWQFGAHEPHLKILPGVPD